jgi:hypothetical protein
VERSEEGKTPDAALRHEHRAGSPAWGLVTQHGDGEERARAHVDRRCKSQPGPPRCLRQQQAPGGTQTGPGEALGQTTLLPETAKRLRGNGSWRCLCRSFHCPDADGWWAVFSAAGRGGRKRGDLTEKGSAPPVTANAGPRCRNKTSSAERRCKVPLRWQATPLPGHSRTRELRAAHYGERAADRTEG